MRLPSFENLSVDQLLTPCLVVCPETIRQNLAAMVNIAGSPERLRPHVKTHKCGHIVRLATELGVTKHKCATLAEAELLAGLCNDVLVAYPLVGPAIAKLAELMTHFPDCRFSTVIDAVEPARELSQQVSDLGLEIDVLIELDPGMHRTGITPGPAAVELAQRLDEMSGLRLVGIHLYDGHHHQTSLPERQAAVAAMMQRVLDLLTDLRRVGLNIDRLVCGGTPTFPVLADWARRLGQDGALPSVELSPGTSVLSDYNYGRDYPDIAGIAPAAILLTRVISKPGPDLITLDLGYKAISADSPAGKRCHFVDLADAEEVRHNEEHLVVRTSAASGLKLGQVLRVVPAHICPTVALHDYLHAVGQGRVVDSWPVDRRRLYR